MSGAVFGTYFLPFEFSTKRHSCASGERRSCLFSLQFPLVSGTSFLLELQADEQPASDRRPIDMNSRERRPRRMRLVQLGSRKRATLGEFLPRRPLASVSSCSSCSLTSCTSPRALVGARGVHPQVQERSASPRQETVSLFWPRIGPVCRPAGDKLGDSCAAVDNWTSELCVGVCVCQTRNLQTTQRVVVIQRKSSELNYYQRARAREEGGRGGQYKQRDLHQSGAARRQVARGRGTGKESLSVDDINDLMNSLTRQLLFLVHLCLQCAFSWPPWLPLGLLGFLLASNSRPAGWPLLEPIVYDGGKKGPRGSG